MSSAWSKHLPSVLRQPDLKALSVLWNWERNNWGSFFAKASSFILSAVGVTWDKKVTFGFALVDKNDKIPSFLTGSSNCKNIKITPNLYCAVLNLLADILKYTSFYCTFLTISVVTSGWDAIYATKHKIFPIQPSNQTKISQLLWNRSMNLYETIHSNGVENISVTIQGKSTVKSYLILTVKISASSQENSITNQGVKKYAT